MNTQPLVSIVIPVFNGSNYLHESIESALAQTYDNIEIIVVNDGSTDQGETEKIALSYGDKVRYFCKENGGVSTALNYGISVMNGEWFSWLSHDDLYHPDKIKKQIDFYNECCSGVEKCVLLCGSELIDCDGKTVFRFRESKKPQKPKPGKEIMLNNLKHNRLGGCTFLVPKYAFDEVGTFSVDNRTMSDFDMWYRLLLNGYNFRSVNESLVKTRIHKKQVTYTMAGRGAVEFGKFYSWVINEFSEHPELSDKRSFYRMANYSLQRGLKDSANLAFSYANNIEKLKPLFFAKKITICVFSGLYKYSKKTARNIFAAFAVK